MNKKLVLLTAVFALTAGWAMAEDMKAAQAVAAVAEAAPAAVEVSNKICPISGEEIKEGDGATIEFEGKIYNVCKMGKAMFDKNPEQFKDKLAAASAQAEEMAEDMMDEAGDMAEDMKEEAGEAVEAAGDAMKDLGNSMKK